MLSVDVLQRILMASRAVERQCPTSCARIFTQAPGSNLDHAAGAALRSMEKMCVYTRLAYYAMGAAEHVRLLFTLCRISLAEVKILSFRTDDRFVTCCLA